MPEIVREGDTAIRVAFDDRIDTGVNARVMSAAAAISRAAFPGVRDVVPAFRTLTVYFDPQVADVDGLLDALEECSSRPVAETPEPPHVVRVPVCYGGEFGPDLASVASFGAMDEREVIARHASPLYRVFMMGFTPGFAYLASVDPRIAAPRRTSPRVRVPAGSVGIAGEQTGVYPIESPGGWRIIGRTPLRPFDPARREPFLFAAGDTVRFHAISSAEYEETAKRYSEGAA